MTFANPAMLWTLLALAPLVGVYFLKVRPRRRPTTAYFLWEKIFHERRSNRLWHRLRNLWSLILMALAFAAIAFALAEPRFVDHDRPDLLIVVDNSASMEAAAGTRTRLDLAKRKASDIVRALDGVQRAAVATVADRLKYESHLTDNPRELLAAIDAIEPTYEAFRFEALPAGVDTANDKSGEQPETSTEDDDARPSNDWKQSRRVLLLSDGLLGGHERPPGIELVSVSNKSVDNIGLVAVDLQFVPGAGDRLSVYYQVASTLGDGREVDLLLSHVTDDGQEQLKKVIPIAAQRGVNPPSVLTVDNAVPGRWIARLDIEDSLAADNVAYLVARRPPPIRVGVLSEDEFFFENSVNAFSHATGGLTLTPDQADVVLAKGTAADAPRAIVFQPDGVSPWWDDLGESFEVGAANVLAEEHPILRHVDPLSIDFVGARNLNAPPGSQVLVASDSGVPLIYVSKAASQSAVVLNLDPVAAEFYFSAWFPTLVHASAMHLVGREQPLLAIYPTAAELELPTSDQATTTSVMRPDNKTVDLTPTKSLRLDTPGFYESLNDDNVLASCSLLSVNETLLDGTVETPDTASVASGSPPGAWLVFLAMIAITAESVLYHRRKVG